MLSTRRGTVRNVFSSLTLSKPYPKPLSAVHNQIRTYAFSRFEDRRPGFSRARSKVPPRNPRADPSQGNQFASPGFDASSGVDENSPLWEAAQRAPASNPEEGLRTLLVENDYLIITRQIEMLNIFIGFEQSNRYVITNEQEDILGYIAEEPRGFLSMFSRQVFRTHRPFRAVVMDRSGSPILWLRRPFSWINSRMFVQRLKDYDNYTSEGEPVLDTFGEVQQRWHVWRRRYDLFLRKQETHRVLSLASDPQPEPEPTEDTYYQFGRIDEGLWAWYFTIRDARGEEIASVNRTWRGFGRELFTDTGRYFVHFTPQPNLVLDANGLPMVVQEKDPSLVRRLDVDERSLVLATAVNIDFDYFSRHSEGGGLGFVHFTSFGGGE